MKTKKHHATLYGSATLGHTTKHKNDAQREIEKFLHAVQSYPDRFAREPYLSFQQHLCSIVTEADSTATDK